MCRGDVLVGRLHAHMHADVSLLGELGGIADQVEQDLPKTQLIAEDTLGHVRGHTADQFNPLVQRLAAQCPAGLVQRFAHDERRRLELQFAGIDLRQIEDVADQRLKYIGRGIDRIQVFALFVIQLGTLEQPGHTDDAGQRCAQFMGHRRKKITARTVGRLRRLLGSLQLAQQGVFIGRQHHQHQRHEQDLQRLRLPVPQHRGDHGVRNQAADRGQQQIGLAVTHPLRKEGNRIQQVERPGRVAGQVDDQRGAAEIGEDAHVGARPPQLGTPHGAVQNSPVPHQVHRKQRKVLVPGEAVVAEQVSDPENHHHQRPDRQADQRRLKLLGIADLRG